MPLRTCTIRAVNKQTKLRHADKLENACEISVLLGIIYVHAGFETVVGRDNKALYLQLCNIKAGI